MGILTVPDVSAALAAEFPEFRDELEDLDGLLHVQLGCLARHTEAAIAAGDLQTLRRHLMFVDRVFARGDAFVRNAVGVSYLEHVFFTGPHGPQAEAFLSSRLREAWRDIHTYMERLAREAEHLQQGRDSDSRTRWKAPQTLRIAPWRSSRGSVGGSC
ncbi:MAG: hypothetical protein M3P24_05855 [Gemmatimonadota bacterium]|nr:hypothetical protein [Gemmatimonadota bacterium]